MIAIVVAVCNLKFTVGQDYYSQCLKYDPVREIRQLYGELDSLGWVLIKCRAVFRGMAPIKFLHYTYLVQWSGKVRKSRAYFNRF